MGYEDDPYIDEDGEPLMDPDAPLSDREDDQHRHHQLEDFSEDDLDWRGGGGGNRSPTSAFGEDKIGKPRKRLVKKGTGAGGDDDSLGSPGGGGLDDWEDDVADDVGGSRRGGYDDVVEEELEPSSSTKKKKLSKDDFYTSKEKKRKSSSNPERSSSNPGRPRSKPSRDQDGVDDEMKELWDTIAGDPEDDQEGVRTADDDAFIDDSGLDPEDRVGSDNEAASPSRHPQAEEGEDNEVSRLLKSGKKKKKPEKSPAEMAFIVERLMAELEVTAEEDAELNKQNKPAINKLKKLPLLIEVLSKKKLQQEFLDHGVLTLLKNWLEPLPDGSLPNMNIRSAILRLLNDFPIDLEQYDRREQLKKSGLGKVIMFLSKSDEETTANRKLAKELVDKWSRPIFNKSTRFEDMRSLEEERIPYRRPLPKKPVKKAAGFESRDDDLDEFSQPKSGQSASRQHASRPDALALDFVVRPQSKIDPEEIRARAKQLNYDQRRLKMNKKLQQLKAPKKKQLQASKVSVEGRGMIKYL